MAANEKTSPKMATLASKALQKPASLTDAQIQSLAAALLTQAPDHKKPSKK
jgi:hypothetical protein